MTGFQIFGSAVAGPLSQKIGRRYVGITFGAVTVSHLITALCEFELIYGQIVGVALQYVATRKGLLLAGKMVNGVAIGGLLAVATLMLQR